MSSRLQLQASLQYKCTRLASLRAFWTGLLQCMQCSARRADDWGIPRISNFSKSIARDSWAEPVDWVLVQWGRGG